jgi:transposase InsO family protein
VLFAKPNKRISTSSNRSTELGERIYIDISSVRTPTYVGAKFWLFIQDDFTGYIWSFLVKAKIDLLESIFDWLKLVKKEIPQHVKCIRLDNSGENKSFHQMLLKSNYNINFEFTAPGTPQQNGKVEHALQHYMVKQDP